jgi:hypothetical protein
MTASRNAFEDKRRIIGTRIAKHPGFAQIYSIAHTTRGLLAWQRRALKPQQNLLTHRPGSAARPMRQVVRSSVLPVMTERLIQERRQNLQ